jgi:hypothetical protein
MICSEPWDYKVRFNFSKYVENSFKAVKVVSRKDRLLLLVVVCIVVFFGVATLIQSIDRNGVPPNESTISQIISEPADWENKTVKVEGIAEDIPLGIIQPFNYWLSDKQNQTIRIGLRWLSDYNLSGRSVTVVGVVKKGYAWVNPNYLGWWTYYIEATSISQD